MSAGCPSWCDRDHQATAAGIPVRAHLSVARRAEYVAVWLRQVNGAAPRLLFDGVSVDPGDAALLASTLASLGYAELAALITRTAELADAS